MSLAGEAVAPLTVLKPKAQASLLQASETRLGQRSEHERTLGTTTLVRFPSFAPAPPPPPPPPKLSRRNSSWSSLCRVPK